MNKIIILFFVWRTVLFFPLWITGGIPSRPHYEYTNIFTSTLKYSPVDSPLLYPWANFDGVHYLDIAGNGYKDNGRFFPLYPLLIRGLSTIFGIGKAFGAIQFFCALFISNLSFLLAIIFLYKLLRLDFSEKISFWTVIFIIFFPTSFFFVSVYSESLFFLLLTLSFYLARKRQWFLACFSTMLLTISRPVGFLMAIPLISEYIKQNKLSKKSLFFMVYSLLFVSLGLMIYSYFCYLKWNDPLYFFHSQALLQNSRTVSGFVFPLQTIYRYLKILITVSPKIYEWWIALLEFLSFWLACYLLTVGWLKKIRPSYLIFSLMCFFVPVFSGTFSGLPRYIIVIFPLFLALSQSVKNKTVKIFYITAGFITQIVLLAFFSRGYFIA